MILPKKIIPLIRDPGWGPRAPCMISGWELSTCLRLVGRITPHGYKPCKKRPIWKEEPPSFQKGDEKKTNQPWLLTTYPVVMGRKLQVFPTWSGFKEWSSTESSLCSLGQGSKPTNPLHSCTICVFGFYLESLA